MKRFSPLQAATAAFALILTASSLSAQGVTTGAIGGTVTDVNGAPIAQAQVQVTNNRTGFTTGTTSRENGQYLVANLEVGGPYTLVVRRLGFQPHTRDNMYVILSQTTRADVRLEPQPTVLSETQVRATATEIIAPTSMGTKTTITQQAIERSPSSSRNLVDLTAAAPQVSSTGAGYSAGGMSNRMNNVQIDGASERDVFGLGATGQPGGQVGAKSISMDAVKEYQILLAPYDVRQGNFGGMLLNAVTKNGTNDFQGSFFQYYRNQDYGRNVPALRATEFNRRMTGFTLGGPIIRDRLHFFTANEWQRETAPVSGPYLGQPTDASPAFGFTQAEIDRFAAAYNAKSSGADVGAVTAMNTPTPMDNMFIRLDYQINDAHRMVARFNYNDAINENRRQNPRTNVRAVFSSNFHAIQSNKSSPGLQLFSNFANGWNNELFVGATRVRDRRNPVNTFPQVAVTYSGGRSIVAGSDQFSQGNELDADTYEIINNLSIPRGAHTFVIGTRNELVKIRNLFSQSSYGVWQFNSIDDFENNAASGFRRAIIMRDQGNAFFDALQSAWYVQDQWEMNPNFNLTLGLRADISRFLTDNEFHPAVDSAFGRKEVPEGALQISPRVGFNWDMRGDATTQLRGGIGLFVGTPPYVWMENPYAQNGALISFLNCGSGLGISTVSGTTAPAFQVDPSNINSCATGGGSTPIGDLSFIDKNLKFPQPMRANLAFDRLLPWNLIGTVEGLYSRTLNQFFFVNQNLAGPQSTDKFGRVLYGTFTTGATAGVPTVIRPASVNAVGAARFGSVIETFNQNKDYAYNLTFQLRRRYLNNWEGLFAYTYGRARDVQSFGSSTHISNWQFGRTLAGRQEDAFTGVSLFDQPHKISALLTRTVPWGRVGSWAQGFSTDLTVLYRGSSGSPHDYVYGAGSSNRGDMNADGVSGNDLIYVPMSTTDPNEIQFASLTVSGQTFTPAQQAAAFEALINANDCLSESRGTILERNSCRLPFSNVFDVSIRQNIPTLSGQRLAVQFDIFNFGNLLNKDWGQQRVSPLSGNSNVPLITPVGRAADGTPIVTYNPLSLDPNLTGNPQPYQVGNFANNYWRFQLSARYTF